MAAETYSQRQASAAENHNVDRIDAWRVARRLQHEEDR